MNVLTDTEKETVKCLINDFNLQVLKEKIPICLLKNKTDEEIVNFFGANFTIEYENWDDTLLSKHINGNNKENVKLLLKAGADPNHNISVCIRDWHYCNILIIQAVMANNVEIVELLIEYGCKINEFDNYDDTALSTASVYGYLDIVKLLLKHNAIDEYKYIGHDTVYFLGTKSLINALDNRYLKVAKELIKTGCDIQNKNLKGHNFYKNICKIRTLVNLMNNM